MKRFTAILLAMVLLLCGCSVEWEDTAAPDTAAEDRSSGIDHINANMAATQDAFYYESEGAILEGTIEKTVGEKIAKGRLIGAGLEQVYYKEENNLYAETPAGRKVLLAETEKICYQMESAQGKDLLFIGEELYLINERDPEDRVGYTLKNHAYACLGEGFIYWYRLEEGNRATLCKTELFSQETEELCPLGYIGTAKPHMNWHEGNLYFYYGYTLYSYNPDKDEKSVVGEYAEGDQCVFWDGKAYLNRSFESKKHLEVVDLKSNKVIRTEKGKIENLSSGQEGVAYRLEEKLVVERTDGISQFSIDKNHTVYGLLLAKTGVFVKTQKEYQFYSYSKV
ncbi:MAG: hypothetical protein IJN80_00015 [Clostridia bacterium]|nr:hypothetical protein [Clostridia bacterium]